MASPFGKYIRATRTSQGLSLRSLARSLGVSAGFLSDVEKGRRLPHVDRLEALAEILDVAERDLYYVRAQSLGFIKLEVDPVEPDQVAVAAILHDLWTREKDWSRLYWYLNARLKETLGPTPDSGA